MKKLIYLILLICAFSAQALEIDANFSIGNLSIPDTHTVDATQITGTAYPWSLGLSGKQPLADNVFINAGYSNDFILKNILFTEILYEEEFFNIGVGPFFGVFNSTDFVFKG